MPTPVDLALSAVSVSRQGYTSAGSTTTYSETLYTTKRVRLPYPNQATLTTDTVALDDYVYSTDTLPGVTNTSAETSPQPVANWVMIDRTVVGNSVTLQIVAFHRNGVACVEFRATDGTNTVTSIVSTQTVLGAPGDVHAVVGYTATLDITSLSDNTNITCNAKVYPRIGAAASIIDSANQLNLWEFSPRTFRKNTSRASAPPIVYVAAGGNDTTGAVSTNDGTASATPCLTLTGAINRARTVLGTTAGSLDGLRVRMTAGTWSFASAPTDNTTNAEIVLEPATGQSKATVTFNFGATVSANTRTTYARARDLTIVRTGAQPIHNVGNGAIFTIENCTLDNATFGNATVSGTGVGHLCVVNTTITNALSSAYSAGTTQVMRLWRGVTATSSGGALNITLEQRTTVGCKLTGFIHDNTAGRSLSGVICAYNRYIGGSNTAGQIHIFSPNPTVGVAVVQNVFEFTAAVTAISLALAHDSSTINCTHPIVWHNTFAGFDTSGRNNLLYNDTSGGARTHKLASFVGNIHVQVNTKHDVFMLDGTRTGGWAYMYGVGCRGEFSRYRDANAGGVGTSFAQAYFGLGASFGVTNTGAGNDPLFTTPQHTTSGPVAGAGNGVYTLQAGSPAKSLVTNSPLPFDLAGTARSGTVAAGAYV